MKLNYTVNQNDAGRFIGFLSLGVLYCLNNKMISIDEAEGFIFKPYVSRLLSEINVPQKLIDIIALGCELEDIESLAPEKLPANIDRLFEDLLLFIKDNKKNKQSVDKEIILTNE
ncbi:DUF3969 domain-containing protein [Salmonella enterica subsp. diarizonae]|nr:DUF3969 domain-containing protein [Salmonella enterica subsp. diarizonae]EAQ0536895.1 DUF3969 family protein [Salmonella enterica]EHG0140481.1 DUF3969 family protein [Salmonella enterica subsp. enterica serovar Virchow]EKR1420348.1 DUF3969 family protein [Salmonella enterica subsp. diarizonae serovar 50:z:z52]ECI4174465.1 DUF3969 domain-containing protein [Salmonella enterica subsp. diarizonae]